MKGNNASLLSKWDLHGGGGGGNKINNKSFVLLN